MRAGLRSVSVSAAKVSVAWLFIGLLPITAAGPVIRSASVSPRALRADISTSVLFTAAIASSDVIPHSVNLQRMRADGSGFAIAGELFDDGTHGDSVRGDGIYSLRLSLREPGPFPVQFRISAAVRGSVKRVVSNVIILGGEAKR